MRARTVALVSALAGALFCLAGTGAAQAQERTTLGVGRLFVNDALGDGQDRWRSGGHDTSILRGPEGLTGLPDSFGTLMEYRLASRILAPANTVSPAPGDRRYAGIISAGAYTHFTTAGLEFTLGAELVAAGPMTQISRVHVAAHELLGLTVPSAAVLNGQFANVIYPTVAGEAARSFALGNGLVLRPFVQGRVGDETYLRVGADLLIGAIFTMGVPVRDETTGLLYQTMRDVPDPGWSFLLGADVAHVVSSAWLPASAGYTLTQARTRMRAGVQYQGEWASIFYGVTRLGPEFTAQPSGQTVGAITVGLRF